MRPLPAPETLNIYLLVNQNGMKFSPIQGSTSGNQYIGLGFYLSRQEAEHQRTLEYLKYKDTGDYNRFHIFELEIPNPAYINEK